MKIEGKNAVVKLIFIIIAAQFGFELVKWGLSRLQNRGNYDYPIDYVEENDEIMYTE